MAILFTNEIYAAICDELSNAEKSVKIMTAYGKVKAIAAILDKVKPTVEDKKIMFRFRLDDIIKGATDFEVIDFCRNAGWTVYVRFDLHAKTYVVDNKRGIVGSANATNSGLSLMKNPNYEMAALVDIEAKDIEKISDLYREALLIDDDLWMKFYADYSQVKQSYSCATSYQWSKDIIDRFNPRIRTLFSYEFPEKGHYDFGEYIQFLDITYSDDIMSLKNTFRWSTVYLWLMDQLTEKNGEIYFGELSARLHNSIVTDPKPYRKDIKVLLSNLLGLIADLDMPEIGIDRPNYSQRVFLK